MANPISSESQAYIDGRKSARGDVLLGRVSEYAYYGVNDSNLYTRNYSIGYRKVISEARLGVRGAVSVAPDAEQANQIRSIA